MRSRIGGARALLGGQLARNSTWSLASTVVATGAFFLEVIVLARYLEPESLGVFFLILAYPEAVQQLLDFRVRDALTRYFTRYLEQGRRDLAAATLKLLWWADVAASLVAFTIVAATASLAAELVVSDGARSGLILLYAVGMLFGSLDSASGTVLRVLERFRLSFVVSSAMIAVRLGLMAWVVLSGGGIAELILARAAAHVADTLIQGAVALIVLRPVLAGAWRSPMRLLQPEYREMRRFMVSTNLTGVFRMAATKLDTIILGVIATPATVALYRIAVQFGRSPLLLSDSLLVAVYPRFSQAVAQKRLDDVRRVAARMTIALSATILPLAVVAIAFSGDVISLAAGEKFREAGPAFAFCIAGVAVYGVGFWVHPLLLSTGNADGLLRSTAAAALLQLLLLVVLVPPFGVTGAGASIAAGFIATLTLQAGYVRRRRLLTELQ